MGRTIKVLLFHMYFIISLLIAKSITAQAKIIKLLLTLSMIRDVLEPTNLCLVMDPRYPFLFRIIQS